jgi:transposase
MAVLKEDGTAGRYVSVKNSVTEIREALERIRKQLPDGVQLEVVVDSRRSLNAVVVRVAVELGFEVFQVSSLAVERYREAEGQPRKDDDQDAFLLARMRYVNAKGCRLLADPQPDEIRLARLARLHTRLTNQRSAAFNRVRSCLVELSPEVLRSDWQGPHWKSCRMLAVLRRWPAFQGLDRARPSTLEGVLRKAGRCNAVAEQARALKEAASRIALAPEEREVVSMEMRLLIEEIGRLTDSLREVDTRVRQLVTAHPIGRKLLAMPGVGPFVAAVLIGELLPLARNVTEAQAATYSGLTPLSRRSGKGGKRSRLARGVNKHLARALYLSAVSARKASALDSAYYAKQIDSHAGHPVPHIVANIALARQRMKVMYKLLATSCEYNKEILIASHLERQRQERARKQGTHAA